MNLVCLYTINLNFQRELEEGDGEKVLPCLVQHKNDVNMDHQCASAVEHWQLVSKFLFSDKTQQYFVGYPKIFSDFS